jgi:hypothetical protein
VSPGTRNALGAFSHPSGANRALRLGAARCAAPPRAAERSPKHSLALTLRGLIQLAERVGIERADLARRVHDDDPRIVTHGGYSDPAAANPRAPHLAGANCGSGFRATAHWDSFGGLASQLCRLASAPGGQILPYRCVAERAVSVHAGTGVDLGALRRVSGAEVL